MTDSTATAQDPSVKQVRPLDATGRELVDAIIKRATALGIQTDKELWDTHLKDYCSYSTWIRLRHDNYKGDTAGQIKALRPAYAGMLSARQIEDPTLRQVPEPHIGFFDNATTAAVFRALKVAISNRPRWKTHEKRAVILTATFGGGKTAICMEGCARHGGVYASATQSWKYSYYAMLFDLCNAIGLTPTYRTIKGFEHALLTYARNNELFLAIDNANTLAPHGLNLLRDLICAGPTVVLVAAIDSFLRNLRAAHGDEAGQLNSRAVAIIDAAPPTAADVAAMATGVRFDPSCRDEALNLIAESGGSFAAFRLITSIVDRLRGLGDGPITMAQVLGAVGKEEAYLRVHEQVHLIDTRPRDKRKKQTKEAA